MKRPAVLRQHAPLRIRIDKTLGHFAQQSGKLERFELAIAIERPNYSAR
jgi:hypothetical protein